MWSSTGRCAYELSMQLYMHIQSTYSYMCIRVRCRLQPMNELEQNGQDLKYQIALTCQNCPGGNPPPSFQYLIYVTDWQRRYWVIDNIVYTSSGARTTSAYRDTCLIYRYCTIHRMIRIASCFTALASSTQGSATSIVQIAPYYQFTACITSSNAAGTSTAAPSCGTGTSGESGMCSRTTISNLTT